VNVSRSLYCGCATDTASVDVIVCVPSAMTLIWTDLETVEYLAVSVGLNVTDKVFGPATLRTVPSGGL
jgi:hypothetical protein